MVLIGSGMGEEEGDRQEEKPISNEKRRHTWKKSSVIGKRKRGEWKGRRQKNYNKICSAQVHIPYDECDPCVYITCTNVI